MEQQVKKKRYKKPHQGLLKQALQYLEQAIEQIAQEKSLPRLDPFSLKLDLGQGQNISTERVALLYSEIQKQIYAQVPAHFRTGTVYCFETQKAIIPIDQQTIFRRYHSMGRPIWESFLNVCLEKNATQAQLLFQKDQPKAIALVFGDYELNHSLLDIFSRYTPYRILGQLSVGFINELFNPVAHEAVNQLNTDLLMREKKSCLVFSIQIIQVSPMGQVPKLKLNILGMDVEDLLSNAAQGPKRSKHESVRALLKKTTKDLNHIASRTIAQKPEEQDEFIKDESLKLLFSLKTELLNIIQPQIDRTNHAQLRHGDQQRPTHLALQDAKSASSDHFYWDTHQNTIVIMGPKARIHIFNEQARHITSFRLEPNELENKQRQGRWIPLSADKHEQIKQKLGNLREN